MTSAATSRFPIRIGLIWRPFMLFVGATPANSYVELSGDDVRLRFGAFNQTIRRDNVIAATPSSWSLINGLGVRAGGQIVGLIGALDGIVELTLAESVVLRFIGFPWTVRRIAISMEDPGAFIAALSA